ncbi:MAG TPA: FecR domain-containing protein [Burkholderiaceae bacterium]|nr:FecR domain-containing protein [Burkholderiaceae bacterium]
MQQDADPLFEYALKLVIRRHGGSPDESARAAAEAARWRTQDLAHEQAWRRAEARWASTSALGQLRDRIPVPPSSADRNRRAARVRRAALSVLAFGAVAASIAGGMDWYWRQPQYGEMLATARAQLLSRSLPDGTRLDLSARTELKVAYYRNRRVVELERGEAAFKVRADADRPFIVNTPAGRIQVVGTSFDVSYFPGTPGVPARLSVAVASGRVKVLADGRPRDIGPLRPFTFDQEASAVDLGAGQAVTITAANSQAPVVEPIRQIKTEDVGDWQKGWFVFNGTPLEEAVARWNAFVDPPFLLGDTVARKGYQLTGAYPIRDPGAFLAGLIATFPIEVHRSNARTLIEASGGPSRK